MKNSKVFFLLGLVFFISACFSTNTRTEESEASALENEDYTLVWSDEFDYSGFPDSTKWRYDTEGNEAGWGNNEAQFYTDRRIENAQVENGILKIKALKENYKNKQYTSARLVSKTEWQYGRFEIKAKLPPGRGTWAAIWMMPGGWSFNDGNWPNIGEFDIMEHVGYDPGVIHASAHSKDYQWQIGTQKTDTIHVKNATSDFHTYTWEWTPEIVKAFVDNKPFFEYENEGLGETKWPYEKPFYLILNLAVGGEWGNVQGIDDSVFPQSFEIDYVRVYQKK